MMLSNKSSNVAPFVVVKTDSSPGQIVSNE